MFRNTTSQILKKNHNFVGRILNKTRLYISRATKKSESCQISKVRVTLPDQRIHCLTAALSADQPRDQPRELYRKFRLWFEAAGPVGLRVTLRRSFWLLREIFHRAREFPKKYT